MKINYTYYKIDIANIREYERTCNLLGKTSEVLGLMILEKIEAVIFNQSEPVFGLNDYDSKDKYYSDYKKRHEAVSNNVVGRFNLNFFFKEGDCFDYDEPIIMDKSFPDFDFWFVLKLRQYEFRLSEIRNFLNFQLETSFNNDKNQFIDFLEVNMDKYQTQLIENEVIDTVKDLIENNFDDKLILKMKYDKSILFKVLEAYFDSKNHSELNQLLTEHEIQNKICFKSNANQFVMIFRQLHMHQKIIGTLKNTEDWICKYFTYLKQKRVTDFNAENVHKILTKQSYDIPKSKRINLPSLVYTKDKS
ncbi:hypothetical protein SAMN04515667_1692 [Formosa sp. Hel1_31_208]|uniref:hypothetical protein n=1 Tax=Formosa sp. Hel1_31_208 TaxID=1798225 RepID=UPI00087CC64B|nr:hypothetical protein [Formosa sp. Hel1_31_208]SDS22457.1 hypothetical protein SAMN04515667_1692 [Formosa sp. Hel1_31_208]